jgi:uncharacterized membrane protein YhaH (DUF805 family)
MNKLNAFSFQGRLNRAPYWQSAILAWLGATVSAFVVYTVGTLFPPLRLLIVLPVAAGLLVVLSLFVRRLHDRGKSGWWLLVMYLPALLFSALGTVASASAPDAGAALRALGLPFSIWMFVELGCLRGTRGPNRYGPDPLEPEMAEVFG